MGCETMKAVIVLENQRGMEIRLAAYRNIFAEVVSQCKSVLAGRAKVGGVGAIKRPATRLQRINVKPSM
jgi:hypothetical protein